MDITDLFFIFFCVTAAYSEEEVNMWIAGLNWLMVDTQRAPAPQQIERSVNHSIFKNMP